MPSEPREISEISELIRGLASHPTLPPLPDPDRLWVLAQIAASEEAAARALRRATLRQALRFGAPSATAVWLFLDGLETEGRGLDVWIQTIASMSADPVVNVAMSAVAALAHPLDRGLASRTIARGATTQTLRVALICSHPERRRLRLEHSPLGHIAQAELHDSIDERCVAHAGRFRRVGEVFAFAQVRVGIGFE
jgi:hypothetical protein